MTNLEALQKLRVKFPMPRVQLAACVRGVELIEYSLFYPDRWDLCVVMAKSFEECFNKLEKSCSQSNS